MVAHLEVTDAASKECGFVGCSDQLTCHNDKSTHGAHANYLIRSDGVAERMAGMSTEPQVCAAWIGSMDTACGRCSMVQLDGMWCAPFPPPRQNEPVD